ncbi:MAG TPA: substrate-binding and VWA domain-containing protein [Actinophytocola sp.]|uniref:substrate-binding and VWA domain-containing protein n=1 Tax=Actinophytocola sp. TaxID=1872138 RepID=UPI002DBDD0D8|nr:substrate-binding and VWA domain-containing protein [Actinophytocola sp.]HEU5472598.1 substrate-binding and VWA domain-containing protein [Actinophytocola sp.]
MLSVLLVTALGGWVGYDALRDVFGGSGCTAPTTVNVVAAPDIAPAITQIGRAAAAEDTAGCYRINVASRDSVTVTESITGANDVDRPDVWIPESTLWLRRAHEKGAWNTPVTGTSVASSPVVLALTEAAAADLGWPDQNPSWAELIGQAAGGLNLGFPDPARDPIGVATLAGLRELVKVEADPGAASTTVLRRLSANTLPGQADLFARLPSVTGPAEPLSAFPTSENALLRYNVRDTGGKLIAVYADPAVPALDYPFVVLPEAAEAARAAAGRFLDRLMNQRSSDTFADAGFRTPDGKALRDRSQDRRTSAAPATPIELPSAEDVEQLLNAWAAVNLSGRLLVLLDVSGSMGERVAGTDTTRLGLTIQATATGLGLLKPTTKVGMWLYSRKLDGDNDYSVLLPMRPVGEHLTGRAVETLRDVKVVPNGSTALYDTVLAAYQDGRQNWEPGRINTVVVLTDGKDDNASDISRDALLAELTRLRDPQRPLTLIGIGIGPDVDAAELTTIAEATGGKAFTTPNPAQIEGVLNAALSRMLCQPPNCQPARAGG